jgi:predicted metal-dependent HD superfamily phosphohydrolase
MPAGVLDALRQRYAEPHRHYHAQPHVDALLAHLRAHIELARAPELIEAAIWFHDAIYDTHRFDNEEASALLAGQMLGELAWAEGDIARVQALVRATAGHDAPLDDSDAWLFLDLDLSVLGQSRALYERYSQAIRAEYAWVDEAAYLAGRRGVLQRFLAREAIYRTPALRAVWEAAARANLQAELATLPA